MSQFFVTLLMLDAAWVCIGLARGWVMWPWIIVYWALLTIKNALDWWKARRIKKAAN